MDDDCVVRNANLARDTSVTTADHARDTGIMDDVSDVGKRVILETSGATAGQ